MVNKPSPIDIKVAIMGAKGYPYVYGGYDTLVKELGERLVEKGVSVRVYNHRSLFPKRPRIVNGIECIYTPAIESKSLTQLSHTFFSMVHACFSDVDVIFVVNSGNGPFGWIAKLFGKPTAINVDGLEWLRPKWKGWGAKYFLWASKMATLSFDQLINDSEEMRRVYLELFNKESVMIAYGANPKEAVSDEPLQHWNLSSRSYYLIVGRLIPDNNADLIIEGFLQSASDKILVVVGDAPFSDAWAQRIKKLEGPRVLFTGYVRDQEALASLYSHCYAYFHGHEFGGTNPAMLKALGYGCAILALNTPFNQEMLQNGKHGWYFEKKKTAIAQVIAAAESGKEALEELRKTARLGLTEKYSWEHVTDQYLAVFRALAKK
jgi:glycosyltransferase involved in cell wall biosynthesis